MQTFRKIVHSTWLSLALAALTVWPVQSMERYGLFADTGKPILPVRFSEIRVDAKRHIVVSTATAPFAGFSSYILNDKGIVIAHTNPLLPVIWDVPVNGTYQQVCEGNRVGLRHKDGRMVIPLGDETLTLVQYIGEGMYSIKKCSPIDNNDRVEILLDENGIVSTLPRNVSMDTPLPFSCGLKVVSIGAQTGGTQQAPARSAAHLGFIDHKGKVCLDLPEDTYTDGFFGGMAVFYNTNSTSLHSQLLDLTGNKFHCPIADGCVGHFENGRAVVSVGIGDARRLGLIDSSGRVLMPPEYSVLEDHGKYFIVARDGMFSVLNEDRRKRFDFPGGTTSVLACGDNGWFPYSVGGTKTNSQCPNYPYAGARAGYVDGLGRIKIRPRFDTAFEFSGGYAIVSRGLSGTIDQAGKFVIPPSYDSVQRLNQLFLVSQKFSDFAFRVPTSVVDMRSFIRIAEANGDPVRLRQAQALCLEYCRKNNLKREAAALNSMLQNRECPTCHSAEAVLPTNGNILVKLLDPEPFDSSGSYYPRWCCLKDNILF
jgi:WG containing repeat